MTPTLTALLDAVDGNLYAADHTDCYCWLCHMRKLAAAVREEMDLHDALPLLLELVALVRGEGK